MALNSDTGDARPAPRWEGIDGGRTGGFPGLWYCYNTYYLWAYNWACHQPQEAETGNDVYNFGGAEEDSMAARAILVHSVGSYSQIHLKQMNIGAATSHYEWKMNVVPGMWWVVSGNSGSYNSTEAPGNIWRTLVFNSDDATHLETGNFTFWW